MSSKGSLKEIESVHLENGEPESNVRGPFAGPSTQDKSVGFGEYLEWKERGSELVSHLGFISTSVSYHKP